MENQDNNTPEEQTPHSSESKKAVDRRKIPSFTPWALIAKEPKNVILGSSVYALASFIFGISLGSAGATMWNIVAAGAIGFLIFAYYQGYKWSPAALTPAIILTILFNYLIFSSTGGSVGSAKRGFSVSYSSGQEIPALMLLFSFICAVYVLASIWRAPSREFLNQHERLRLRREQLADPAQASSENNSEKTTSENNSEAEGDNLK